MLSTSVIIPCRDAAPFLDECLASCASDRYVREIIVVDDRSQDDSVAIARSWERTTGGRVVVTRSTGHGANVARNVGLAYATSDLVQWLDADDYMVPGALTRLRAVLVDNASIDIAYGDFRIRHDDLAGQPIGSVVERLRSGDVVEDLLADAWRPPGAFLVRATLARRLDWDPEIRVGTDRAYWFDAALAGARFRHVEGAMMIYRRHGPSMSTRDPAHRIRTHLAHLDAIQAELVSRGAWTPRRRAAAAYARVVLAKDLVANDRHEEAHAALATLAWADLGDYRRRFSVAAQLIAATAGVRTAVELAAISRR